MRGHFNSIKVRLEPKQQIIDSMQEVNFNSIKVRLEPNNTDATVNAVVVFQFHKGTIRTRLTPSS